MWVYSLFELPMANLLGFFDQDPHCLVLLRPGELTQHTLEYCLLAAQGAL